MTGKSKSSSPSVFLESEEEIIAYQRLIKELNQEPGKVWVEAIDPLNSKDQLINSDSPWVLEDNNDALSDYMNDVSDYIDPEDINYLDW